MLYCTHYVSAETCSGAAGGGRMTADASVTAPIESKSGRFWEVIIFITACRCREGVCTVTKNASSEPLIM